MSTLEAYIRQAAARRGIDPDIAVRVARSEGGLKDPVRQSLVVKNGRREPSYGPFQLLIGGGDTGFPRGMGNDALAAGIDPRDPNQWQRGIDFALDNAAKGGWGPWYGAKASGIGRFDGIGGKPAVIGPDGPKGQESYPVFGSMAVASSAGSPGVSPTADAVPASIQNAANPSGSTGGMSDIFGMMAALDSQQPQFSDGRVAGPSPEQALGLGQLVEALKKRMVI